MRLTAQVVQDVPHRSAHVLPGRLRRLHVDVDAPVLALGPAVQQVTQGQESRGLARLPGRVQDEIPFLPDQGQDLRQVQACEWRDTVVLVGAHGSGGVEVTHGRNFAAVRTESNVPQPVSITDSPTSQCPNFRADSREEPVRERGVSELPPSRHDVADHVAVAVHHPEWDAEDVGAQADLPANVRGDPG